MLAAAALALAAAPLVARAYTDNYSLNDLPHTWQTGQTGYNDCGSTDSQTSMCQTAHVNSVTDFCLWAPPTAGPEIGASEEYEVTWCTASGHGARVMPEGTISSAHFLETEHYVQVTGTGDFTKINVKAGDEGGELDPHGATGLGNPIGSLVFNNGVQIHEWMSFISDTEYCFRVCKDSDTAWLWCQHVYDVMGCEWVMPGDYGSGFDTCQGDGTVNPPGIYTGSNGAVSTFSQGDGHTPAQQAAGSSSQCAAVATVGGAAAAVVTTASSASASSASSVSSASSAVSTAASSTDASSSASSAASSSDSAASSASDSASAALAAASASSFSTSILSSAASSSGSVASSVSASSSGASSSGPATTTFTSTQSSATSPVSTVARAAASPSSSSTSGAGRLVGSALGSLAVVGGAMVVFA